MVEAADSFIQLKKTKEISVRIATEVCILFKLASQPHVVCPDMIKMMVDSMWGVISTDVVTKNRVCN